MRAQSTFSADFSGKPLDYYRNLRVTNPSNYLYFYDFGEYQIIGASPESLVSVKDRVVTTNPIAGTRPRGIDERVIGNWQLIWQGIQKKSQNTGCWWI